MVTADVPASIRVKTIQDSQRRRFARIRTDDPFQGLRIRPEASIRLQSEETELYQPPRSHSLLPRIRDSGGADLTDFLLEDRFIKGPAEEIAPKSEGNFRVLSFVGVPDAGSNIASRDAAEWGSLGKESAFEMAAQGALENLRSSWPSQLQAWNRGIAGGGSLGKESAFEMAAQGALENLRSSWPSQLQAWKRGIAGGGSLGKESAFEMAAQGALESLRSSWPSQLQAWKRGIAGGGSLGKESAFEMAAQGALESLRSSWSSQPFNDLLDMNTHYGAFASTLLEQRKVLMQRYNTYLAEPVGSVQTVAWPPVVKEFAIGIDGVRPEFEVVKRAAYLVFRATSLLTDPDFTVDSDGALAFDLQLPSGHSMLAELYPEGRLGFGVYDENRDSNATLMFSANATEEEMIDWFSEEAC